MSRIALALSLCSALAVFSTISRAEAPKTKAVYFTVINGNKYFVVEYELAAASTLSYELSSDLRTWSAPGIDGYPGVVETVSLIDSTVRIARIDQPIAATTGYFLRATAVSTRKPVLDFDGDGITDFAVVRSGTGSGKPMTWFISYSAGGFAGVTFGSAETDIPVPGDYDGDGKCDIAIWRGATGQFRILESTTGAERIIVLGQSGDKPVVADYDGDGRADPAVLRRIQNEANQYIYVGSDNNPDGAITSVRWGGTDDSAVIGDYDGDGKADFCVQSPQSDGTAVFLLRRSSDGGQERIPFGASDNTAVDGDFDGDLRSDFAVIAEISSKLEWTIFPRNSGAPGAPIDFGLMATDLPVPGDYDGDGKQDIAIWRSSSGTFYVRRSSDGGIVGVAFGVSGDYPVANFQAH